MTTDQSVGRYVKGCGQANGWAKTRAPLYVKHFGCPLIGTFNVRLDCALEPQGEPAVDFGAAVEPRQRYYLCSLVNERGEEVRGWFVRWRNESGHWRPNRNLVEIYTKRPVPDSFREQGILVTALRRWTGEERSRWAAPLYWWQGYPWLKAPRSESMMLWERAMGRDDWTRKSVLDYGCHTGLHAIEAARRGAVVVGVDRDREKVERAQAINDHIEMQDAMFHVEQHEPEGRWDVVLHLSVLHQYDPSYRQLPDLLSWLRRSCDVAWLELINPPLRGGMSAEEVDRIVGVEPVLRYQHKVRRWRSLYRIAGQA